MDEISLAQQWLTRAARARSEAHRLLAMHEASRDSRVLILEDLLSDLRALPIDVQSYFEEATACLRHNLLRAAVVMSWTGFIHVFLERLYAGYEADVRVERTKWAFASLDDLKESYTESALLDVAKVVGMITKAELRDYQGKLGMRNKCAHPTLYAPSLNSALGYVDDMIREARRHL